MARWARRVSGTQKKAVITGASSGIGRALALHLAERGDAARRIARPIERGRRICSFPWQTAAWVRLARAMPFSLHKRAISKQAKAKKANMPKKQ